MGEYTIVLATYQNELVSKVNTLRAEGWELHGDLIITSNGTLYREMVRPPFDTNDPEKMKVAGQIIEAIDHMGLGVLFTIVRPNAAFEVRRTK